MLLFMVHGLPVDECVSVHTCRTGLLTVLGCGLERVTFKAVCGDTVSLFSLSSPVCVNQTWSHNAIQVENTHPRFLVK